MTIAIRVDASASIGTGHVMRCLTLAGALREKGADIRFVCREHPGHLCGLIESAGYRTLRLPPPNVPVIPGTLAHSHWLGVSQEADARQTQAAIGENSHYDWLIVDHYALDANWESAMRSIATRIMVIDDLADRKHECDLLLDQNLAAQMLTRYAARVPARCGLLLGPEYALLQPIYAELHDQVSPRAGPIRRIFIFFGGADGYNVTGRTLTAFLHLERPDIEVDVVITAGGPHADTIRRQAAEHSNIHIHSGLPTLAPLMAKADLAIGASGATSWERLCLGLPSLVVTLSENQRPIAAELSQRGLIQWLGHQDRVDEATMALSLSKLLQKGLDGNWSRRCFAAVDGKGINRVCAALTVTSTTPLRVRHAGLGDEALLLVWANDPATRSNAFTQDIISAENHRHWLVSRLSDVEGCRLYIVETSDGAPLGQVRFEKKEQVWHVDYSLGKHFRGRGLASRLLEAALFKLRDDEPSALVLGQVKDSNQSSQKVFESLGFDSKSNCAGVIEYHRVLR